VMLPLLTIAADGKKHQISEATNILADQFRLTDSERKELLPSGVQSVFRNRVGWARTFLKKAGLIEYPRRGHFEITKTGRAALGQHPSRIDVKFLQQFSKFAEFYPSKNTAGEEPDIGNSEEPSETPEDGRRRRDLSRVAFWCQSERNQRDECLAVYLGRSRPAYWRNARQLSHGERPAKAVDRR
jgi:restriction endonuclease Mrr